jgi:hypothetical protein
MGSLRVAPDVVCFSTMFSGTNGLTSFALTAHGAIAIAASSMLPITRTRDPSRLFQLLSPWPGDAAMMWLFLGNYSNVSLTFGPASKLTAKLTGSPLVVPEPFFCRLCKVVSVG